jgi:hypothetical protein
MSLDKLFFFSFVGATNLLVRLSHVAPMSVFACLGQEAVPIRDAFVARLKAHVEVCVPLYTSIDYQWLVLLISCIFVFIGH